MKQRLGTRKFGHIRHPSYKSLIEPPDSKSPAWMDPKQQEFWRTDVEAVLVVICHPNPFDLQLHHLCHPWRAQQNPSTVLKEHFPMGTFLDPLAHSWIEERKKEHKSHSHFQAMERRPLSLADEDPFAFPGYGRRIPPSLPDEERAQKPFALPGISTANLKSDLGDVRIRMHRKKNRASDPC